MTLERWLRLYAAIEVRRSRRREAGQKKNPKREWMDYSKCSASMREPRSLRMRGVLWSRGEQTRMRGLLCSDMACLDRGGKAGSMGESNKTGRKRVVRADHRRRG